MSLTLKEQRMELFKPKGNHMIQMTFDEDVNVPDIKPDVDRILQTNAQVFILNEELLQDKVMIQGELKANVLYLPLNDKKPIHSVDLVFPFEESMNVDGVCLQDHIYCLSNIEDLAVQLINSRKVHLKALVQLKIEVHEKKDAYITTDVEATRDVEKKMYSTNLCQLKESKKDTFKIKDEIAVPQGKPNIMEIVWHEVSIQNNEFRLVEGKINLRGTLHLAALYFPEDQEANLEFIENDISFNGLLDCDGCRENMILDVQMNIADESVQIRPDIDGEERVISIEVDTKLDMRAYQEEEASVLADVYSLEKDLQVKREPVTYQKLLYRNQSQANIRESILVEDISKEILQVYYTSGTCSIENIEFANDKMNVEGVLFAKVMFVAADDHMPINVFEAAIPFEHQIDLKGLSQRSLVGITPRINYIGCTMIGAKEIEIRCTLQMNVLIFDENVIENIVAIEEKPLDMKLFHAIPGIVGYIVKDQESIWDIAKKYRTTIDSIRRTNHLDSDNIRKGDALIIVKEHVAI